MPMIQSKKSAIILDRISSRIQSLIGWILIVLFGFAFIFFIVEDGFDDISVLSALVFFLFLGIVLAGRGRRKRRLIKLFRQYAGMLSADPEHTVAYIASCTGEPTQKVVANLERMISKRYLSKAFMDYPNQCVVFPDHERGRPVSAQPQTTAGNVPQIPERVVACLACGANNRLADTNIVECEYCGSPLQ